MRAAPGAAAARGRASRRVRAFVGAVMTMAALLGASLAWAQGAASAPASAAKKELVARVVKLQQGGVDNMARQMALEPALQLAAPLRMAASRLPPDRREAFTQQVEADLRRYSEEVVPIVRDRAAALAPATLGPMIEQRFTEDELKQLIALLESPINARYQALGVEMQRALGSKVVAETRAAVEPKYKALEQNIQDRLRAATAALGATGAPPVGAPTAPAAPAAPASGRSN